MTEIEDFLEEYRSTWEAVCLGNQKIGALTRFFATPCLMVGLDGVVTLYASETEIEAFNETRRAAFVDGGVVACRFCGVDVSSQGRHMALATVNWELLRADGALERAWRHYYSIHRSSEGSRILVSAFQVGA